MGVGGIPGLSQITSVFMGEPKVQEIQQEYQGGIQTGSGDIATQLASLDRLEQGTAPKGQGLEMGYKDSLNSALENAGISNLTLQPAKEVLFGDVAREDFQTAELEKMQKEVFKTPISPNIPLLQTPIAPKKEPYAPPERQEKTAERTLADIEAFKAYGGQTGGMVPDSSRLQETGIGFPAPEVRSALYKQPLAPITEQMQRAKLGAAQGQVPVPQQQNEPAGVPQMYGKPTNEMPKDNIDAKAEPGDVIINNKAMILLGMKNFNKMVGDGVDIVRRMGFTIEERLNKLNKKDIVPLLVSKGEARIPNIIAKAIGMDRLRKINDRGKRAIVAEEKAAAQQKEKQKYTVKKGGVIPQKKAFGDVVESAKKFVKNPIKESKLAVGGILWNLFTQYEIEMNKQYKELQEERKIPTKHMILDTPEMRKNEQLFKDFLYLEGDKRTRNREERFKKFIRNRQEAEDRQGATY